MLANVSMRLVSLVVAVCVALDATAQTPGDKPEQVIRALVRAMYSNDAAAFIQLTVPDARVHLLTTGGSVNSEGLRDLKANPAGLQIVIKRQFQLRGVPVKPGADGNYPFGTTAVYMVAHRQSPMMMVVEKRADGWKVDPRWWLAMVETASGPDPGPGTATYAARRLLIALIAMDTTAALRYAVPRASPGLLFAGAPRWREPSGHLDALAMEMPIVEIAPGSFYRLPTGRVLEGSNSPDMKLLVGIMGSVEMPFLLRRISGEWKVEPQPYFALIMQ